MFIQSNTILVFAWLYIYLSVSLETYLHSPSIYSMFFTSAVFREGDEGTSWYIILRGSVNLMVGKKVCLNCVYTTVIYNGIWNVH